MGRRGAGIASFSPGRGSTTARREPPRTPEPSPPRFETGDEVLHDVFGQGIVIDSKPSGGDEQVTVAFAGVGLKRLMAGMSPMEKTEKQE